MLKNDKIEGIKYEKVDIHHLNPKSITMGQLLARRVLRCLPRDSWPSHFHESRFFFEEEAVRVATRSEPVH